MNHVPPTNARRASAQTVIYRGISPWKLCLQLLVAGLVAGAIGPGSG